MTERRKPRKAVAPTRSCKTCGKLCNAGYCSRACWLASPEAPDAVLRAEARRAVENSLGR